MQLLKIRIQINSRGDPPLELNMLIMCAHNQRPLLQISPLSSLKTHVDDASDVDDDVLFDNNINADNSAP